MSHSVVEYWRGQEVETLADLIPPKPRAICVGVNPAPPSVAAGHYYQGALGKRFFARLRQAWLLPPHVEGWEDDAAFALGVGFTDLVKRPTARASDVTLEEVIFGRGRLIAKLEDAGAPIVIFTFKKAAEAVMGKLDGNGFVPGLMIGDSEVFVMPGPYEKRDLADRQIATLRRHLMPKGR